MASELLNVSQVFAGTEDKPILHGIDLSVGEGECHVLMGPNGAGKSTLGHVIMGDPTYRITGGSINFAGADLTDASADKRSLAGIFLSYQAPVEVPGVPLYSFLRTICQMRPELKTTARKFRQRVGEIADQLDLDQSFLMRELNVGFSSSCCCAPSSPSLTRPTRASTSTPWASSAAASRPTARSATVRSSSSRTTRASWSAWRSTAPTSW